MGNTSNYILIILAIDLFMGMIALSVASVDPSSELLLSNKLFGTTGDPSDNPVVSNINNASGVQSYDWNSSTFDTLGSEENSVLSTTGSIVPDWIKSGWKFLTDAGRTYLNFVGAPFTIVSSLGLESPLAALIGCFFGIFSTFIFLNWLLGRDT